MTRDGSVSFSPDFVIHVGSSEMNSVLSEWFIWRKCVIALEHTVRVCWTFSFATALIPSSGESSGTSTLLGLFSLFSRCSHLEHRASVKRFVSLQFLNPKMVGIPGQGMSPSQGRYLQHKHGINADKHPCLELVSNPRSQRSTGEDSSYLRPRGHCDRCRSIRCS
jgi:hypothetical protein